MATTPPPRPFIHTPPTPRHGPRHDSPDFSSPRRSSRIAGLRTRRIGGPVTEHRRENSQTFSPPSSPEFVHMRKVSSSSPSSGRKLPGPAQQTAGGVTIRDAQQLSQKPDLQVDSGGVGLTTGSDRVGPVGELPEMLPTPSKTPRKRLLNDRQQADSAFAARVLFPGRLAHADEAMPSPKKTRRSGLALTLDDAKKRSRAFSSQDPFSDNRGNIHIYTDTKDRLPSYDPTEDNPFITERDAADKTTPRRSLPGRNGRCSKTEDEAQRTEEAIRRDEGVLYVFRGKKIFRRFDGDEPDEAHSPTADPTGTPTNLTTTQDDQQRSPTRRRFTRSSIQPRLLWPADEQHHQEHLQHEAEEAPTDIEEEEQHHLNNTTAHTVPDLRDDHAIGHRPVADNVNADNPKTAYPTAEGAQQTSAVVSPANERTIDTLNEADVVRSVFDAAPEAGASASFPGSRAVLLRGNDRCSPFDKWRRSKAGASQPRDASAAAAKRAPKRESDDVLASGTRERGKRTKGGSFGATEAT